MSTLDERLARRTSLGTWTFDDRFSYRAGLGRIFNAYGPNICELCYYITSPGGTFTLRSEGSVSYVVDWGDGSSETSTSNALAHTYAAGDYIIKISSAVVYRPNFNSSGDEDLITEIHTTDIEFGAILSNAWRGANNMTDFNAAFGVTTGVTSYINTWRECSSLTSFPLIDTSSGTNFGSAWQGCSGLTSFPLIDVSSGTTFANAWINCSGLTDFPANFFDSWTGTPINNCFTNTWTGCSSLTATSVENILNSIDTSGQSAPASGVDITLRYDGVETPNISTAVTNLKSRGWTITLNGVAQ